MTAWPNSYRCPVGLHGVPPVKKHWYASESIAYREWDRMSPAQRKFYNCALDIVFARPLTVGRAYRAGDLAATRVTRTS